MNYQQTLVYLFEQLPMFSKAGSIAYKANLTNTIFLCNELNNPQLKFSSVHIAGTNGKGSVSHTLAAVLQTAGYKTGLYTSPHLKDFRERIKVNGIMCSEEFVVSFTKKMQQTIETIKPSFFEITVAMAFEYFAQQQVDIAIIETGLGGRLDSTNIIKPQLSIITNIGLDHIQILGETIEKIAYEKAGIIKEKIPVIIGEATNETKHVFDKVAKEKNAPIYYVHDVMQLDSYNYNNHLLQLKVLNKSTNQLKTFSTDLLGIYQTKNILTVLTAVHQLQKLGFEILEQHIYFALKNIQQIAGFKGRWQILQTYPTIIADVAHNEDGIQQVLLHLKQMNFKNLHIVIGMVKDKDVSKVLSLLPKNANYYFTQAQIPRALSSLNFKKLANTFSLNGNNYDNVTLALHAAKNNAITNDLILVIGSVFLVGEIENL